MDSQRFSLMTFLLDADVVLKKMSVKECLLLAKQAGFPYVDVMNPSERRLQEYISAAKATGVKTLCYIGIVSFFSNSEDKIRELLSQHLRSASALGAKRFMIVPVNIRKDDRICNKLGKIKVRQRLKKYFSIAVDMAKESSIKVCFETTPQDYTCLSGIEDCRWVLEQVPQLGLVYDTANMLPHGDDPVEYYKTLKSYVVHTHVKDVALSKPSWMDRFLRSERTKDGHVMKCCVSGQGIIPLREILSLMEQDGYQGTFALEYSHPENYPADYSQNAKQLKRHLDGLQ